jgi:hypothetical protein
MRYFLPELYVQANAADDDVADDAAAALERASEEYNQHWASIKEHLPASVIRFYEEQMLHDADVLSPAVIAEATGAWQPGDVVIVAQQVHTLQPEYRYTLAFLRYGVVQPPSITIPIVSRVFCATQPTWLHDEFDLVDVGVFSHTILLSDGRVIRLVFRDFDYSIAPLVAPEVFKILGAVPPAKAVSA